LGVKIPLYPLGYATDANPNDLLLLFCQWSIIIRRAADGDNEGTSW